MTLKKLLTAILALAMVFAMTACSTQTGGDVPQTGNADVKTETGDTEVKTETDGEQNTSPTVTQGHFLYQNIKTGEEFYITVNYDSTIATPVGMDFEFTVHGGGKLGLGGMVIWSTGATPADCMTQNRDGRARQIDAVLANDGQISTTDLHGMEVHYFSYGEPAYYDELVYEFAFALPEGNVVSGVLKVVDHNADFSTVLNELILDVKLA